MKIQRLGGWVRTHNSLSYVKPLGYHGYEYLNCMELSLGIVC